MPETPERCPNPECRQPLNYRREGRTYSRAICVNNGRHDYGLYWICPACNGAWHRWPQGTRQHQWATETMTELRHTLYELETPA